jgi:lysophospholipase L1-like esterase
VRRIRMLCPMAALVAGLAVPAAASAKTTWYVSLGDSLAQGVQPNAAGKSVPTKQGYADAIFKAERRKHHGLKLKKLGCPGETSTSMIKGGICHYAGGSQLAAARKFLRAHDVAFVTLDIGANDVDGCLKNGAIDGTCVTNGLASVKTNVPLIVSRLRTAAGKHVRMVGMTYYDPFLAFYLKGGSNQGLAIASVALADQFNAGLTASFAKAKFKVADVAKAYQTDVQTPTTAGSLGTVPTDVAQICALTWMCAPAPLGPNIHANADGYKLIAATFEKKLP